MAARRRGAATRGRRDRGARVIILALSLASSFLLACGPKGAALHAEGSGSFTCPGGHGCIAWLAVRPAGWSKPASWQPGSTDGRFPATSDGTGQLIVSGQPTGGPTSLAPGDYWIGLVHSEVNETQPLVLGTDEKPGTGLRTTWIDCEAIATVDATMTVLVVRATFGPPCAIDTDVER